MRVLIMWKLNTHNLIGFDISSSGDIMCFANEVEVFQWVQSPNAKVNDFSNPFEELPVPPVPGPNQIADSTFVNAFTSNTHISFDT